MTDLVEKLKTEPVAVVSAIVAVLTIIGIQVSPAESDAAVSLIVAVFTAIGAVAARRQVTPVVRADARALRAYEDVQVEGHPGRIVGG